MGSPAARIRLELALNLVSLWRPSRGAACRFQGRDRVTRRLPAAVRSAFMPRQAERPDEAADLLDDFLIALLLLDGVGGWSWSVAIPSDPSDRTSTEFARSIPLLTRPLVGSSMPAGGRSRRLGGDPSTCSDVIECGPSPASIMPGFCGCSMAKACRAYPPIRRLSRGGPGRGRCSGAGPLRLAKSCPRTGGWFLRTKLGSQRGEISLWARREIGSQAADVPRVCSLVPATIVREAREFSGVARRTLAE